VSNVIDETTDRPARTTGRAAFRRALGNPFWALRILLGFARGWYYRAKFRLLGRRVIVGRRFFVLGRLDIRGPGTVIFGDDCVVLGSSYQVTTPWTHTPEAVIRFGNRVMMSGTRIGCVHRIDVDDDAGLSDGRIIDNDFHSIDAATSRERAKSSGRSKRVHIKRNAWLGTDAMVLKGVTVGENAVIGARAVVTNNVPDNAVVFGNPARVVWRVNVRRGAGGAGRAGQRTAAAAPALAPHSTGEPAAPDAAAVEPSLQV